MNGPTVCDPSLTILVAAILALAVFSGGLAAFCAVDILRWFQAKRFNRITLLQARIFRRPL